MDDYATFLASKRQTFQGAGIEVAADALQPAMFGFQRDLTRWALRKGRAAQFWDCGLGKSLGQLAWAEEIARRIGRVLIIAPLTVAQQTVAEAGKFGIDGVEYARHQADSAAPIVITNYEMVEQFDPAAFAGVVLDESGILKSYDGVYCKRLIEMFAETPYRLCCTATPAPNDVQEFANHAEFLGILSRVEMLATWFVHDDQGWRLKRHAVDAFYRWMASWGMAISKPSDLGYPDDGFTLPALSIEPAIVPSDYVPDGQLFATALHGVGDRAKVRRGTLDARVKRATEIVFNDPDSQWIAWCGLNEESAAVAAALPAAVEVTGSMSPDEKTERIRAFQRGDYKTLVTKIRIAGYGLNLQCASRQVFVGIGDSYEQYYQAIRRSYRFGQTNPVVAHIVLSDLEQPIYANVLRKERESLDAQRALLRHAAAFERSEIATIKQRDAYQPAQPMRLPAWLREGVRECVA